MTQDDPAQTLHDPNATMVVRRGKGLREFPFPPFPFPYLVQESPFLLSSFLPLPHPEGEVPPAGGGVEYPEVQRVDHALVDQSENINLAYVKKNLSQCPFCLVEQVQIVLVQYLTLLLIKPS